MTYDVDRDISRARWHLNMTIPDFATSIGIFEMINKK